MSSKKPFHKNSGDWKCANKSCGNLNFARRDACNRCKKPREESIKKKGSIEIGQAAAKNSRGLFSADDWSCTKCGNINWARRVTCNICNSKKIVDEDERTGYGGGFNEREKIEYKRHSDSSDEYDEFGRKRKNRKRSESDVKKRKSRRERSRSSSSSSSTSTSSSSSRSSTPERRRGKSRSNTPKRKSTKRKSRSRSRSNSSEEENVRSNRREKSSSKSDSESSEGDEDLSKYNLFDDDIDIEALKAKK